MMKGRNTLRAYKQTVTLRFAERGDRFTLDVPHRNKWRSVIRFLKRRGFKVAQHPYFVENAYCLSKYHRLGVKGDVRVMLEIAASSITVNFCHVKNMWDDAHSYWDIDDDRSADLTYMELKSVEIEQCRLYDFVQKYGHEELVDVKSNDPVSFIRDKDNRNKHIHGGAKGSGLDYIADSITEDSYNFKQNSKDANGNHITSGELKYYYDTRTRRLLCGRAWHNINNMWWVVSGKTLRNVCSRNLMDFHTSLPRRRELSKDDQVKVINRHLQESVRNMDFLESHRLKSAIESLGGVAKVK